MDDLLNVSIVIVALILSVWPGVYLVGWLLRIAIVPRSSADEPVATAQKKRGWFGTKEQVIDPEPEILRGGAWIGALERIAITLGIVFGQVAVVAVVVAVKGLGRFSELKSSYASEKFVIGTLCSFLWAGIIGALALWLLHLVQ